MKLFIFIFLFFLSLNAYPFPIPKDNKASFDIVRKNKVIGFHSINFVKKENELQVSTQIEIKVKVLFIPAYEFFHVSTETWVDGEFIQFEGHTDFEDEREYFIKGKDEKNSFVADGMDGKISMDVNILPSNLWNKNILYEKEVFDIQKGIKRNIQVKELGKEKIKIDDILIDTIKFSLNATSNPKDKGPFPEYTLWYNLKNELIKYKFTNWKDKKDVIGIRNDLLKN